MTTQHPALRPSFLSAFSSQGEDNRATCRSGGKSVPVCHRIPGSMQHGPGADHFRGELSPLEKQAWLHRRWPAIETSQYCPASEEGRFVGQPLGVRSRARSYPPRPAASRSPASGGAWWPGGRSSELGVRSSNSSARQPAPRPAPAEARQAEGRGGRAVGVRSSEFEFERPTTRRSPTTRPPPGTRRSPASGGAWRLGGRSSELGVRSSNSSARQPAPARQPAEARQPEGRGGWAVGARSSEFGVRIRAPDTLPPARHPPKPSNRRSGGWRGGRSSELGARSSNSSAQVPAPARQPAEARQPADARQAEARWWMGARRSEAPARGRRRSEVCGTPGIRGG